MSVDLGSRILVILDQIQQEYTVCHIDDRGIYISPVDNPNQLSLLIFVNGEWKVYDEQSNSPSPVPYQIEFLDINYLLSLPYEVLLEIALRLPLTSILNICSTNRELNELICESEYFWSARTRQDYPNEANLKEDSQTWKDFYRLLQSNYIWSFGWNQSGQLGLGDNQDRNIPTQIMMNNQPVKAKQISTGETSSIFIDLNNYVWIVGHNARWNGSSLHPRGLSDDQINIPTQVFIDNQPLQAKQVSTGTNNSLIIDLDDNVWAFGDNRWSQLGIQIAPGDSPAVYIPTQIFIDDLPLKAKQVSAGREHSLIIDLKNNVWTLGNNTWGQLGLGDDQNRNILTQIIVNNQPLQAKQVSTGYRHSLIIDMNNNVWSFGWNYYGQLGLGNIRDRNIPTQIFINNQPLQAKQVSATGFHSLIIDMNNNVWSFGFNNAGQLGLGDIEDRNMPTQIFINDQPVQAKQISAGFYHSLILDMNNNIWSFGSNQDSQLGSQPLGGLLSYQNIPTQIMMNDQPIKAKLISAGGYHSLIIRLI